MVFCLLAILSAQFTWAETPQDQHDQIKKSYFRLKNIDSRVSDVAAWTEVISQYRSFIENGKAINDKVYLGYGNLLQEFGQARHESSVLDTAMQAYEDLVKKFPESSLADDAILRESEILALRGGSADAITDAYQEILERFPNSDSAEIARMRLKQANGFSSGQSEESPEKKEQKDQEFAKVSSLPVIVLDPGHGGNDFGAENEFGLMEKDVVLAVALETERLINAIGTAKVLLTRRTDVFVPLSERIALANNNNAVLFLSIHNNASPKHNQNGMTTYVLDDSSDESSRLLAERENKSAGGNGDSSDLDFIISDLVQSSKHPKSLLLAEVIDKAVIASVRSLWQSARSAGIKKAPFYVLVGARMPCSLVELFFIDQEVEGERLSDPEIRTALARGIAKGIASFMAKSRG